MAPYVCMACIYWGAVPSPDGGLEVRGPARHTGQIQNHLRRHHHHHHHIMIMRMISSPPAAPPPVPPVPQARSSTT